MPDMATDLDRACELSGKLGGISYEAGAALSDLKYLKEWIGGGKSRKALAMKSLSDRIEKRLASILKDSK
jgi:hypothetical protein